MSSKRKQYAAMIVACCTVPFSGFSFGNEEVASRDNDSEIETIEVRSYFQPTSIEDTASNIAVVNAETLALVGATHISESLQRVPGVWISRGNGQEHLTAVRSPVLTGAGGCGAFYMAEDNISLRASGFCNANQLFDVNSEQAEQIEVIRGPASVLYGSNAVHGVINVITPDVGSDSYLSVDVGPHDYHRLGFFLTNTNDDDGFAVYGTLTEDGGYKDESGFGQQKVSAIYQTQSGRWDVKSVLAYSNLNQETSGFIQGFKTYEQEEFKRQNPNPEAFRDTRSVRWYARLGYQISDTETLTVTPYFRHHDMTFLQHFVPWQPLEENGHHSIGTKVNWWQALENGSITAGLDIDFTQGELTQEQDQPFAPPFPVGFHYDYEVDARVISAYVDRQWQLSGRLDIFAGGRFEHVEYDYENNLSDGSACDASVTNCRFSRPTSQDLSFSNLSLRLGATYSTSENGQWFTQLSQGFRAPQATELFRLQAGQTTADLDDEKTNSVELGYRYSGNIGNLEVTSFYQRKYDYIFQDTQRQNVNNGETRHVGLELGADVRLLDNLTLATAVTYARHTYDNDINLSNSANIEGNEIDTAPRLLSNATLSWSATDSISAQLEWQHSDDYFLNPENTAEYDGHNLWYARVNWQESETVSLTARVNNLFDTDYAERADFAFGNYRYFVGEPRSVYLNARVILY